MLSKLKQRKSEGFTIIEVMIVLAIAGLIILIVLLAVPALQRNSRNTQVKNDATALTAAISEYKSNNDGKNPTAISAAGVVSGAAGTAEATPKLSANAQVTATATPAVGDLGYQLNAVCPSSSGSPNRTVAVYYRVESTSATAVYKCIES